MTLRRRQLPIIPQARIARAVTGQSDEGSLRSSRLSLSCEECTWRRTAFIILDLPTVEVCSIENRNSNQQKGRLGKSELLLMSDGSETSFDGRYFGPVDASGQGHDSPDSHLVRGPRFSRLQRTYPPSLFDSHSTWRRNPHSGLACAHGQNCVRAHRGIFPPSTYNLQSDPQFSSENNSQLWMF